MAEVTEFQAGDPSEIEVTILKADGVTYWDFDDLIDQFLRFQSPTGASFDRTGGEIVVTVNSDPADPDTLSYTFASGELLPPGNWQVQGWIQKPDGAWHTNVKHFKVNANIPAPA